MVAVKNEGVTTAKIEGEATTEALNIKESCAPLFIPAAQGEKACVDSLSHGHFYSLLLTISKLVLFVTRTVSCSNF